MELKITTLIENMPDDEEILACEHGLSLYIEFDGRKILFDTGQTGEFVSNAQKLGKSLAEVDYFIISHGHYDHSGGVMRLVKELKDAVSVGTEEGIGSKPWLMEKPADAGSGTVTPISMYVGAEFFHKKYKHLSDGTYRYNGNPFREADLPAERLALHKITEDVTYLEENIMIFKNFKRVTSFEKPNPKFIVERFDRLGDNPGISMERAETSVGGFTELPDVSETSLANGKKEISVYEQDDFRDEIALGLRTTKGLVLVVGCSHVGIVNISQTVMERTGEQVYSVLGGTHLMEADEERLDKTMISLRECGLEQIAVSHCTGDAGMEKVAQEFGSNFVKNNTGHVYVV